MNKNNKDNSKGKKQPDKETQDSVNNGKKAVETQKKTAPVKNGNQDKAAGEDAEKWRNEG